LDLTRTRKEEKGEYSHEKPNNYYYNILWAMGDSFPEAESKENPMPKLPIISTPESTPTNLSLSERKLVEKYIVSYVNRIVRNEILQVNAVMQTKWRFLTSSYTFMFCKY
jgi:hypothetical protein